MAFKPSMRSKSEDLDMDLDIRPVMNLMVVLIPLLLQGAEWVKLGAIEINVPPTKSVGSGAEEQEQDQKEEEKRLGLKIAIVQNGITIANASALLGGETGEGPTVPNKGDGEYDYDLLKEKLVEIKKKIAGKGYRDENRAVITASREVEYQILVDVIDNIQTYQNEEGQELPLFPEINFGSIVQ